MIEGPSRAEGPMKILVTAGNTQAPIDRVRCITNIFSGRTGALMAARAFDRGHEVTLLTSHPDILDSIPASRRREKPSFRVRSYRTFDELATAMADEIQSSAFDVVIHAAAVSDYRVAGIFAERDGKEVSAGKVKSTHPELWLRLVPTPKLVDQIRSQWGFAGVLVKFKLEVGLSEDELRRVAEAARLHSRAELMVANTLEGMGEWALLGGAAGYEKVPRDELADRLMGAVEAIGRA
jgi:phosphopantothenate-cysteine ligase/phosphopantothenoylcysteine decarboxylase/phosphopantothenate--cysteine ligase